MEKAIIVKNVSKTYKLYQNTKDRLLDLITPKNYGKDFYALSNVDFVAEKGQVIGFIGINGSGKSTLSNIISGIVPQSSGEVIVNGEVSIIAVAAGLNNELTGRDNIELKLLMLGFNKSKIKELEKDIIEFSELEQFIDQPVKSYSSGMKSRLGFAISVNIDPDILVIDEALSVGDKAFAEKSLAKMNEFKEKGKTMIFVSHSLSQMRQFCDKILWLEFGKIRDYGDVNEILPKYESFLKFWKKLSNDERKQYITQVRDQGLNPNEIMNEKKSVKKIYKEKLVSRVGRINSKSCFLYEDIHNLSKNVTVKNLDLGNTTFYVKKLAYINGEKFYLLSEKPSYVQGTIGWVKSKYITSHNLIYIDSDAKQFEVIGEGRAYRKPWGWKDDTVIKDLEPFRGETFYVERTEKVKNRIWYYGKLDDIYVWIHEKRLKSINEK